MFSTSTDIYLNAKAEMIAKDMDYLIANEGRYFKDFMIEYWMEHPGESAKDLTSEDYDSITGINVSIADLDEKTFEGFDDRTKLAYARNCLASLSWSIRYDVEPRGYFDCYILYPLENNKAFVIMDMVETKYKENKLVEYFNKVGDYSDFIYVPLQYKYTFGTTVNFNIDDYEGLSNIIENKEHEAVFQKIVDEDNKAKYIAYHPIYNADNEFMAVLCVEYDWSDVYSDLLEKVSIILIKNLLAGFLLCAGLVLLALFFVVIKPLRKVKGALDVYMVTKNSLDVESKLSDFKSKNEIGVLAYDVRQLAYEIDDYTDKNIELASNSAKVKTELDMAAAIQRQSLIKAFPKSGRFEVIATMTPAKEVGGDFYDIFDIDDDHTGFVIADVSGKGMPAALLMMAAMTSIRHSSLSGQKPSEILATVNNDLVARDIMGMFVTVWLGILDKRTGLLITGNAGHENPVVCRDGKFEIIRERHGLVVGAMEDYRYRDFEIQLNPGDSIFVYTDGVPEATDADMKMFGEERMLEALNAEPDAAPDKLLRNVKLAVDKFVGSAEQFDDLTMMYIVYKGQPE
jgi:Serine phosphatase RsbU, regulator of sigma subunit